MQIQRETLGGAVVLKPSGRIDQNTSEEFQSALLASLAEAPNGLVLDMRGVGFISSMGLRALMTAVRKAKSDNVKIALSGLTPTVKEVFSISRFTTVIPCLEDLDAAVAKLKG